MQIILNIKETETTRNITKENHNKYEEIISALIESGSLSGVKSGKTVIHFDSDGTFSGIELDYWPFRRRSK